MLSEQDSEVVMALVAVARESLSVNKKILKHVDEKDHALAIEVANIIVSDLTPARTRLAAALVLAGADLKDLGVGF